MRDLGSLGNCLMEGEEGAGLRSPRRRRIALLLSILVQVIALTALVLAPLLVRGERLPLVVSFISCPRPPRGLPDRDVTRPNGPPPRDSRQDNRLSLERFQPHFIPPRVERIDDAGDPGPSSLPDTGPGLGVWGGTEPPSSLIAVDPVWQIETVRPPAPEPPRRIRVTEINPAQLIRRVQPTYPPLAKQTGLQGTVVLRALIGTDGAVREVQLVSGPYLLAQAAMQAVLQWRYQPTLLNGQPVEVETRITVIFTMNR